MKGFEKNPSIIIDHLQHTYNLPTIFVYVHSCFLVGLECGNGKAMEKTQGALYSRPPRLLIIEPWLNMSTARTAKPLETRKIFLPSCNYLHQFKINNCIIIVSPNSHIHVYIIFVGVSHVCEQQVYHLMLQSRTS